MPTVLPYFFYSLGILVREGSEALLVVVALLAAVREAGQERRARDIYAGALVAIGLSLVLAWAVNHLIADDTSDTLEGVFQLLAAATLFYVSSWLTARGQSDRWRTFLHDKVEASRDIAGPSIALGLTAFLAVMREGAETIVFFQALLGGATETAERHAVMAGLLAGALALGVIFLVLRKAAFRIPLGSFFTATSVLLYGLAVIFVGQGISSFQESGVMRATFVDHVPTIQALGLFPTVQTLAAQAAMLGLAALALFAPAGPRKRKHDDTPAAAGGKVSPRIAEPLPR
ncbi:MAG TPA: FTR1 family protein [Candidatus Binataceae bacterium]|nr:FTR1 family protein [Candidatus Binataceae bacterium]